MAGSGSTRATVYNKAGVGVRKMEAARWLAALVTLIVLFAGIYLYSKNNKTIASFGLLVSFLIAGGFLYWVKAMGDKTDRSLREPWMRAAERSPKRRSATCWGNSRQDILS